MENSVTGRTGHARMGSLVQYRKMTGPIGNRPAAEAEETYYAQLDIKKMDA